ncbi:MAG: hypothetical protein AAF526_03915 [Pseudomonadota bacterium]
MTKLDGNIRGRIPVWAFVLCLYTALAATHVYIARYVLSVDSTYLASNYLSLSITFATVICLLGLAFIIYFKRTLYFSLLVVQVGFSVFFLFLVWTANPESEGFSRSDSLYFSLFYDFQIVGQSAIGDQSFHAASVLVYYLMVVPLVVLQLLRLNRPNIQLPRLLALAQEPRLDLPKMSADAQFVVEFLHQSIAENKARANWVLRLILLLLIAGVLVIAFAGQITNLDLVASNGTTSLDSERSALITQRSRLNSLQEEVFDRQNARIAILEVAGIPAELDSLLGQVKVPNKSFTEFQSNFQRDAAYRNAAVDVLTPLNAFRLFVRDNENAIQTADDETLTERAALVRTESNIRRFMQNIGLELRQDNKLGT